MRLGYYLQLLVEINKTDGWYCDSAVDNFRWYDQACADVNITYPHNGCELFNIYFLCLSLDMPHL